MKDQNALAYINMFAVLKDLEKLCEFDERAKELASPAKPVSISFNVGNGPQATLSFENGKCTMTEGLGGQIKLKLASPEAFNQMIDGVKNPLPYGGFTKLKFLMNDFKELTDIMNRYLRADETSLKDRKFFEKSTTMMFYLIASALSAIGNNDELGKLSASKIPDGSIAMEIAGGPCAEIVVKGGHMTTICQKAKNPRAYMIFGDFDTARGLFDGTVESMSALAVGKIVMKGYIPMIDNLNRILSRVAVYLA
ncbi:MAG: hypothetical protein CVU91_07000 [Firmicutes bacterium HGW-Firmicutes-16]|nr:MAG: hypothetical protein CVU91_07000 [Firmicutes bacterium HGW-Firmicutes-16]